MAQKKQKPRERQIGKQAAVEKKPLIDPRYKNLVWTIVIILILLVFFIINNTRDVPAKGPYPPNFNPETVSPDTSIPNSLDVEVNREN